MKSTVATTIGSLPLIANRQWHLWMWSNFSKQKFNLRIFEYPVDDELFENKNYKELLALSFFDVDFGAPPQTFNFIFEQTLYSITSVNLQSALGDNFISETQQFGSDSIIIDNKTYWTTFANIDSMKAPERSWISAIAVNIG